MFVKYGNIVKLFRLRLLLAALSPSLLYLCAIMKQQINFITLGVSDLARSRYFYARLGWKESASSQEFVAFFQAGAVVFALFPREALADDAGVPAAGSGFSGVTLSHNVASEMDVIATLVEAVEAGATLARSAGKTSWGGFCGYFSDPDGYVWEVCFNPFMPLQEDGSIRLP